MIKVILILIVAIIIAAVLFTLLKKAVKLALFVGLVMIVFIVITSILYPETSIVQKGKNYILGKSGTMLEKGKNTVTSYVIVEANQSLIKAREKIFRSLE